MELLYAEHFLTESDVAVHFIEVSVNGFDEVGVNLGWHLGSVERGGKSARIFAGFRKEAKLFELRVKGRGNGVLELAEAVIIGFKNLFSELLVRAFKKRNERTAGKRIGIALFVGDARELEVGVFKGAGNGLGRFGHFAGGGKNSFALGRENVFGAAADAVNAAAIGLELRLLLIEPVEGFLGDSHNFGGSVSAGTGDSDDNAHCFAAKILIGAVGGVLVAFAAGVAVEHLKADVELVVLFKELKKVRGAFAELAAESGNLFGELFERLVFGEPGFVAFKYVLEVPGELLRNFASF